MAALAYSGDLADEGGPFYLGGTTPLVFTGTMDLADEGGRFYSGAHTPEVFTGTMELADEGGPAIIEQPLQVDTGGSSTSTPLGHPILPGIRSVL